jgi:hypothetical protein
VGTPRLAARCVNMRLSPDQLLVKCSQCGAWPMSLTERTGGSSWGRFTFRCTKCHAQQVFKVGVGGWLIPATARSR